MPQIRASTWETRPSPVTEPSTSYRRYRHVRRRRRPRSNDGRRSRFRPADSACAAGPSPPILVTAESAHELGRAASIAAVMPETRSITGKALGRATMTSQTFLYLLRTFLVVFAVIALAVATLASTTPSRHDAQRTANWRYSAPLAHRAGQCAVGHPRSARHQVPPPSLVSRWARLAGTLKGNVLCIRCAPPRRPEIDRSRSDGRARLPSRSSPPGVGARASVSSPFGPARADFDRTAFAPRDIIAAAYSSRARAHS